MATRAEQFRSEEERRGRGQKAKTSKKRPKKSSWSRKSAHAASKATHALEETTPGRRPSRESTRASANRAKPDVAMNLTEEKVRGSPESRAQRSRAQAQKVRGSGS